MKTATINRLIAMLMTAAALGLFGVSGVSLTRAWPALTKSATQHRDAGIKAAQQCRSIAARIGFAVKEKDGLLQMSLPAASAERFESAFYQASVVVASCAGFQLEGFCAGADCGGNSLFMVLRPTRHERGAL
jgi:hypothetical protein